MHTRLSAQILPSRDGATTLCARQDRHEIEAIRQPITATSGAEICNHSERVTLSPPMRCGPMSKIASAIETNIPAEEIPANQLKIRMAKGCFISMRSTCRRLGCTRLNCRGARRGERLYNPWSLWRIEPAPLICLSTLAGFPE